MKDLPPSTDLHFVELDVPTQETQPDSFRLRVFRVVHMIPLGKVATYGQVATLAGRAGAARACGTILRNSFDEPGLPWHRVINAQGRVSQGGDVFRPEHQRRLLVAEGVHFSRAGRCSLREHAWAGPQTTLPWE